MMLGTSAAEQAATPPAGMTVSRHRRIPSGPPLNTDDESNRPVEQDPTGRYLRFPHLLGRGACKRVFRGFDCLVGKEVAWNQVELMGMEMSENTRERLFAEIHVLQQLHHKNIMSFDAYWYNSKQKTLNFITEIFLSGTLRQYRKKLRVMNESILKRWAWQILEGLVYLHGHTPPVIHRDLKADNIFIQGNTGLVKIGDLGLATAQQGLSVVGTPEFMAPEIYEESYDQAVDIYSFGMCLLELATLELPYSECHGVAQIFRKVTQGIKPQALQRVISEQLRQLIEICIAHDPKLRPEARELLKHPFFAQIRNEQIASTSHTNLLAISGSQHSSMSALPQEKGGTMPTALQLSRSMQADMHFEQSVKPASEGGAVEGHVLLQRLPSTTSPLKPSGLGAAGAAAHHETASLPLQRPAGADAVLEKFEAAMLQPHTDSCQKGAPSASGTGPSVVKQESGLQQDLQRQLVCSHPLVMNESDEENSEATALNTAATTPQHPTESVLQRMLSISRVLNSRDRQHQSVNISEIAKQLHKHDGQGPRQEVDEDALSESSDEVIIPIQCLTAMERESLSMAQDACDDLGPLPGSSGHPSASVVLTRATSLMPPQRATTSRASSHSWAASRRTSTTSLSPVGSIARMSAPLQEQSSEPARLASGCEASLSSAGSVSRQPLRQGATHGHQHRAFQLTPCSTLLNDVRSPGMLHTPLISPRLSFNPLASGAHSGEAAISSESSLEEAQAAAQARGPEEVQQPDGPNETANLPEGALAPSGSSTEYSLLPRTVTPLVVGGEVPPMDSGASSRPIYGIIVRVKQIPKGNGFHHAKYKDRLLRSSSM